MTVIINMQQLKDLEAKGELCGLFEVPKKLYREGPGISRSELVEMLKSMKHYEKYKSKPHEMTPAKLLGDILHTLILEPHLFWSRYALCPKCEKRSNVDKATWKKFNADMESKDMYGITQKLIDTANAMVASMMARENFKRALNGYYELTAYWVDEETGILCKCRFDVVGKRGGFIADIKKTTDASPEKDGFIKSVDKFKYVIQNAFYADGLKFAIEQGGLNGFDIQIPEGDWRFIFLAVEEDEPHEAAPSDLPMDYIENGRERYQKALKRYAKYLKTKKAQGYSQQITTLQPAPYMYR